MEQPNASLIQFDSVLLDVNENPSHANYLISDVAEQSKSSNVSFPNDLNLCDSSNYSEPSFNSQEMPECSADLKTEVHTGFVQNANPVSNNSNYDSGIHDSKNLTGSCFRDSENVAVDNGKLVDITSGNLNLSNGCHGFMTNFNSQDNEVQGNSEVFHDAVQFFKDPTSLTFLENAGGVNEPFNPRSSLYVNFDPLHAKFSSQIAKKSNEIAKNSNELEEISEDNSHHELPEDSEDNTNLVINKHLVNVDASPRQSLGNILISFDSPAINKDPDPAENPFSAESEPPRLYTEEELQQTLKIKELSMQEVVLKNQQELELERTKKIQEMETKIAKQNILCSSLAETLKEVMEIAGMFSDKEKHLLLSLENVEKENVKLKEDLKTSVEDLQSVENTFSDFHKRYEQCKSMLKVYTQNEGNLKQQIENMNVKLQEKEEMYNALQSRTEEMLDKANIEVANAKKSGDSQIAVLKAQLKKAELKISSMESDVKHVKIENDKLSSICDELMTKVSEG